MNRHVFAVVVVAIVAAAPPALAGSPAFPMLWAGHLEDQDGPVNRTVSAAFTVTDASDVVVDSVVEAALVVVDGDFVVELTVPEQDGLLLSVVVNGESLEPATPLPVRWPAAARADVADTADAVDRANAIGGISAPLSIATLSTSGAVGIPLANIQGFPADFLDGDDGLAFAASATIDFSGGVIGIKAGSLPGTALAGAPVNVDLAPGAIGTADLANAGVTTQDLSNLPVTKIAAASLKARNFGASQLPLFTVTEPRCSTDLGAVVEEASCRFTGNVACTILIGNNQVSGHVPCAAEPDQTCRIGSTSDCLNTPLGALVFP